MRKGQKHSDETRRKMRESHLGKPAWNKGLICSPRSAETRRKISSSTKGKIHSDRTRRLLSESLMGHFVSSEVRSWLSQHTKNLWKDPEFVAKQMAARNVSQNKAELLLQQILDEHFPNQWKFVGDGHLIVAGKCPDFVHTSRPLLIELFGDYWHDESEIEPRVRLFEAHGYQTLIIWEHELTEVGQVVQKVDSL